MAAALACRVSPAVLLGVLVAWLGLDMILTWRFLGIETWLVYGAGATLLAALVTGIARTAPQDRGPSVAALLTCLATSLLLFLLGGEGRLFYANPDWIVRDGVLHDMATHPWPFAYVARGVPEVLRAPIGMYLVPALAMGWGGQAVGDAALLIQNAVLLTVVLGLAMPLFDSPSRQWLGLGVFIGFSGLDILYPLMRRLLLGIAIPDHLEWWAAPMQYSAHLTQIFWVPQHALAGWTCAAGFMLWRIGKLPLGPFLALVPLTTLWSPLAAMGAMPFAVFAGVSSLGTGRWRWTDVLLPGAATLLALPALLYLQSAGGSVGGHPNPIAPLTYTTFMALEVLPYIAWLASGRATPRFGWSVLALVAGTLLLLPALKIGISADFMMRASIPALAILSVTIAHALLASSGAGRLVLAGVLAIGAVTGLHEIARALRWPASPPPLCTFIGAWGPGPSSDKSTYLAPVDLLPSVIRPVRPTIIPPGEPARCWARPWPRPSGL